jgi:hypothetical protein
VSVALENLKVPRNLKAGQLRYRYGLVPRDKWSSLDEGERDAVNAFSLHLHWRDSLTEHPALEGRDRVFLTVKWMQGLLRAVGARRSGEKAAQRAIGALQTLGVIEDTGETKKPRRPAQSVQRARRFQPCGDVELEGGKDSQPTLGHSYWWRVFRVPALTTALAVLRPQGAYAHVPDRPQHLASLSALLRRQGDFASPARLPARRGVRPVGL